MTKSLPVPIVVFSGFQVLDATGPLEVFSIANRLLDRPFYRPEIVATGRAAVETSSGLRLLPARPCRAVRGPIDTLIIAGGIGVVEAVRDRRLVGWIGRAAARSRRVTSVCTGAFLLAEAGLLDGRRATTHWSACERLAAAYPGVTVDPDPIFVRDGDVWTSAGVTAGMDLALALVAADHDGNLARAIARQLVLFLRRAGGQSQFSVHLATRPADREPIRETQTWIAAHLAADLPVEALASRAAMSPRNFARVFRRETGETPARYVERTRVEAARRELEEGSLGVEAVALECGFGTPETMRRAFLRNLGVPPGAYRSRFRAA